MRLGLVLIGVAAGAVALAEAKKETPGAPGPAKAAARAEFRTADGKPAGEATLEQTPNGVLVRATFTGLPPGSHAFHVHETGKCEPPFKTAGGHFNPAAKKHGFQSPHGMHAGDLPNIEVTSDGKAKVEFFAPLLSLSGGTGNLFDADGSALVVHAGADDYATDPAGNAGDRIACAVVVR